MAVKRSVNKVKAPIKRAIKRDVANADVDAFVDGTPMDVTGDAAIDEASDPNLTMTDTSAEDFQEAPLTPEQEAAKATLEGSNAAAKANNATINEQKAVYKTAEDFKRHAAYQDFLKLPLAERRKLIDIDQAEQKKKLGK